MIQTAVSGQVALPMSVPYRVTVPVNNSSQVRNFRGESSLLPSLCRKISLLYLLLLCPNPAKIKHWLCSTKWEKEGRVLVYSSALRMPAFSPSHELAVLLASYIILPWAACSLHCRFLASCKAVVCLKGLAAFQFPRPPIRYFIICCTWVIDSIASLNYLILATV